MELKEYSVKHIHYYSGDLSPIIERVFIKEKIKAFADLGCGDGPLLYALLLGA